MLSVWFGARAVALEAAVNFMTSKACPIVLHISPLVLTVRTASFNDMRSLMFKTTTLVTINFFTAANIIAAAASEIKDVKINVFKRLRSYSVIGVFLSTLVVQFVFFTVHCLSTNVIMIDGNKKRYR